MENHINWIGNSNNHRPSRQALAEKIPTRNTAGCSIKNIVLPLPCRSQLKWFSFPKKIQND